MKKLLEKLMKVREEISDEVWDAMTKDPEAKEFIRIHSQILNGGMSQLVENEDNDVNVVRYLLRNAKEFVREYAPNSYPEFKRIVDQYDLSKPEVYMDRWGNWQTDEDISEQWDKVDKLYYDFYEKMEDEIEANYRKAKGLGESVGKAINESIFQYEGNELTLIGFDSTYAQHIGEDLLYQIVQLPALKTMGTKFHITVGVKGK